MLLNLSNPTQAIAQSYLDIRRKGFVQANIRVLWHQLFDPLPKVSEFLGADLNSVFEEFLEFSNRYKLSLDWKICLYFFEFLAEKNILSSSDQSLVLELLAAGASRWIGASIGSDIALKITSSYLSGFAIVGIKELGPGRPRKVLCIPNAGREEKTVSFEFFENLKVSHV
jgi:hypothetical protein